MTRLEELRKKVLAQTKKKVEEAYKEKDRYIIQAIEAVDDLDAAFNLLVARTREWYALHFPEVNNLVKDHEKFLRLVVEIGNRKDMEGPTLAEILGKDLAEKVASAAKESMGTELSEKDLRVLQSFARNALEIRRTREQLRKYIEEEMERIAPNVKALVGPLLGARLIAKAGGLKKLAMLPASTIQVLGAEKALFRHLTKGTRPPKHGILFQHPWVRTAKRWQRGKIARSLAAKIAIAAREDFFGGKYIADKLLAELKERLEEIKTKYAHPPKRAKKGRRR